MKWLWYMLIKILPVAWNLMLNGLDLVVSYNDRSASLPSTLMVTIGLVVRLYKSPSYKVKWSGIQGSPELLTKLYCSIRNPVKTRSK